MPWRQVDHVLGGGPVAGPPPTFFGAVPDLSAGEDGSPHVVGIGTRQECQHLGNAVW